MMTSAHVNDVRGIYDLFEHPGAKAKAHRGLANPGRAHRQSAWDDATAIASRRLIVRPVNFRQPVASS
jgi:hypothetical protein